MKVAMMMEVAVGGSESVGGVISEVGSKSGDGKKNLFRWSL